MDEIDEEEAMRQVSIAVVCAYPRKMNFGMLSVDLSVQDFLERSGFSDPRITLFNVEKCETINCGHGATLDYSHLIDPDDQLSSFDLVIIWGDFLTSEYYVGEILQKFTSVAGEAQQAHVDMAYKVSLFEGCSDGLLSKTLILGGNILANEAIAKDTRYYKSVTRLYKKCLLVAPRDPVSLYTARYYAGDDQRVTAGVDGAFFLNTDRFLIERRVSKRSKKVGYSFSRSMNQGGLKRVWSIFAYRFARGMAAAYGGTLERFDWHAAAQESESFVGAIRQIHEYDFVITDTYHCAINCWREQVPAVCLGRGALHQRGSLSDKKKELLYLSLLASKFYVFVESFSFLLRKKRAISTLLNEIDIELDSQYIGTNIETTTQLYAMAVRSTVLEWLNNSK